MQPRDGFIYNTQGITLALGGTLVIYMENPAGSGKDIIVEKYRIPNQASGFLEANFYRQYTKTGTLTTIPAAPFRTGNTDAASALIQSGTQSPTNLGNGAYIPLKPSDENEIISAPLIISQGTGIAAVISAVISAKVSFQVYTREVANTSS